MNNLKVCLREAGEMRQTELVFEQLVAVGKLCMMKKMFMQEILTNGEGEKKLKRWIEANNVIYISVCLRLMNICVGENLMTLAKTKKPGITIEFW